MNTYSVGYSTAGVWTFCCVRDISIHSVLEWTKAAIQPVGLCVTLLEDVTETAEPEDTRSWLQKFRNQQWGVQ